MYLQIAVTLMRVFSYVNCTYVFVFIFALNHIILVITLIYLPLLSVTLFVYHFVPPCEVIDGKLCLSTSV